MCHRCHQEQVGCSRTCQKEKQAVRLKHAAASAFAESLPSMPQLLLPQHPCNGMIQILVAISLFGMIQIFDQQDILDNRQHFHHKQHS